MNLSKCLLLFSQNLDSEQNGPQFQKDWQFIRNTGSIVNGRIDSLYPFIFLAWIGTRESLGLARNNPDREGLFSMGQSIGSGSVMKHGIILPVELCSDKSLKEKMKSLTALLRQHKGTKEIQHIRAQIHQNLDLEELQWLRIEERSDIRGFVELEPTRELFKVLQKDFRMVAEMIDQPERDVIMTRTKPMPWFSRGDLMEWRASIVESPSWSSVIVYPFLVFADAVNWKPNINAVWKSSAIETWASRSAELLTANSNVRATELKAKFIIGEAGWATLRLCIDKTEYEIQISYVYPPFWDILSWVKMVDRGEMPVAVTIDEEGTEKVLSAEPLYNSDLLLFRLTEKYETGFIAEDLISKTVLVEVFRKAFRELLATGFDPEKWGGPGGGADEKNYLSMADDEWFRGK